MKKENKKYLIAFFLAVNVLFFLNISESFAVDKYITGKVVYSDDLSPVSNCNIKVFRYSELTKSEIELENTAVNSNGEFKIFVQPETADGIKIMAYPEELDNSENPFEKKVIDYKFALENRLNDKEIIIEVKRIKTGKSQGEIRSDEKNNIVLKQNFPNPFNPTTSIRFDLPNTSKVSLKIYNMNGANVATLLDNKNLSEGINEFEFNAGNLPSGIYIYTLNAGEFVENRKMILLK